MMQCGSSYILEGFRLRIRFVETGLGEEKTGEKECGNIGR